MSRDHTEPQGPMEKEEKAPLFVSWNRFYLFVILHLAGLIVLFYLFTKAFD